MAGDITPYAEEFGTLERLDACRTVAEATDVFTRFLREHGFTTYGVGHLINPAVLSPTDPRWFNLTNWPDAWADAWKDQRFILHDPVVLKAHRTDGLFSWDSAFRETGKEGRLILNRARDFGLKQGLAVSVHRVGRPTGALSLSGERPDLSAPLRRVIEAVCTHAFIRLEQLHGVHDTDTVELSCREREVLVWLAAGKSDWEIGAILTLSEHTVRNYVRRACAKLGTNSRITACVKASLRGLIPPV